ncbi:MAG: hypothetical protein GY837_02880 [Bosea sp.]|nr:hypothetical protein [Bosea sp. (in: a-proteobacteria)]
MNQNQAPDYDRSGRFPIDEGGWQVINLERDLYPGGPWALRVLAPGFPVFHCGYSYVGERDAQGRRRVVMSHLGGRLAASEYGRVTFTAAMLKRIQDHLRAYAMLHAGQLFGKPILGVDFVAEDRRVEIF